jgi:CRP-like cAMP-binding protein
MSDQKFSLNSADFMGKDKLNIPANLSSDASFLQELELKDASLSHNLEVRTYPAGSTIFVPEESSCEHLYILLEGRANLYRLNVGGKRLVTRQIMPGSVFGVRALLGRAMQKNFAEAVQDSRVLLINKEHILELLEHQPSLALKIMIMLCNRLCLVEEHLIETAFSPVSTRLACFLLTNADSATGVLNGITHEEIGDVIGAARQTVTQALNRMRKHAMITTDFKQIRIIDRQKLEGLICPAPIAAPVVKSLPHLG